MGCVQSSKYAADIAEIKETLDNINRISVSLKLKLDNQQRMLMSLSGAGAHIGASPTPGYIPGSGGGSAENPRTKNHNQFADGIVKKSGGFRRFHSAQRFSEREGKGF